MGFDTKYRPQHYRDLVGQDATVAILRQFVQSGAGFHQSYLFAGPYGGGKTTTARLLARSLMCDSPVQGESCNLCENCKVFLRGESPEGFTEFDAATNSGKDDIRKIVEESSYATFTGNRRLYLIDEAHALSTGALDGLLKSLEDCKPGSQDKRLVCIFCTTEPEKMRATILSRCAPAFLIKTPSVQQVADRLAWVCEQESLEFDHDTLKLVAQAGELHLRNALKAVEGISMIGAITRENALDYLMLGSNDGVVNLLGALILKDKTQVISLTQGLLQSLSPGLILDRLIEASLLAYRIRWAMEEPPPYWDGTRLRQLGQSSDDDLLRVAASLSCKPSKVTVSTLLCDLLGLLETPKAQIVVQQVAAQAPKMVLQPSPTLGPVPKGANGIGGMLIQQRVATMPPAPKKQVEDPPISAELFGEKLSRLLQAGKSPPTQ